LSPDFFQPAAENASASLLQHANSLWVENVGPDLTWMTPQQVAEEVRSYIRAGVDFLSYSASDHRGAQASAFLLFSPLVQRLIVEEAHRAGITAQAHTTSVEALRVAIEAGTDIIEHGNITGPVPIPDSTLEMLAKSQAALVVFPYTERRLEILRD